MPRIRRRDLPPALLHHLLDRVRERSISSAQLQDLAAWLDTEPEVPSGQWFKRLGNFAVCGEGEWIKTLLGPGQHPSGTQL